jgi:hypothetical protein
MSIVLKPDELAELTDKKRPADQLRALHEMGFVRAFRSKQGRVILERTHFEAVTEGRYQSAANEQEARPRAEPNRAAFLARYAKW